MDPRPGRAMFERLRLWQRLVGEVAPAAVGATPCRERLGMALAIAAPTGRRSGAVIWFPRLVGILTALYGLSAIARPDVIARDGELASSSHRRSAVGLLSATVGMRDLVSGIAIVLAPAGGVLLAGAVHAGAFDVGDAAVFGRLLPAAAARRKIRGHGAGLGHSAGALDDLSERLTAASP